MQTRDISPADFGLEIVDAAALKGGDAVVNAQILRDVLDGKQGPALDIVLFNAAAAIAAGGMAESLEEGLEKARSVVAAGAARAALDQLVAVSNA